MKTMTIKNLSPRLASLSMVVMAAIAAAGVTITVQADVLELNDGTVLDGSYMGGSQSSMRFKVDNDIQVIPLAKILALTITSQQTQSSGTESSAPGAAAVPAATATSELPSGTRLLVKTLEAIDTRNNKAGSRFSATLEGKLMAGEQEIVPANSKVYGEVVTSSRGGIGGRKPVLELRLTEILIDGERVPVSTALLSGTGEGGGAGKKTLKGAAIGGLVDGSSGARDGAKIGLGVAILAGGNHAGIRTGSLLEFQLSAPLKR